MWRTDVEVESELLALLRAAAQSVTPLAAQVVEKLDDYASRIADPAQAGSALVDLDRYAHHHKGLIDAVVPSVDAATWRIFVSAVRKLSRQAIRRRGLDTSPIGRLYALAHNLRIAP